MNTHTHTLVVVVLLAGCVEDVCVGSNYTTEQGICVFDAEQTQNTAFVQAVVDIVEEEVMARFNYTFAEIREKYIDTNITFVATETTESNGYPAYTAYTYGPFINKTFEVRVWRAEECRVLQLLAHELVHVIDFTINGIRLEDEYKSENHPKKWFSYPDYSQLENEQSIEYMAQNRVKSELCSD
jgi:hypothetical protein